MKVNLGTLEVHSPAFAHGQRVPDEYSSNGVGVSPELSWTGLPPDARSLALVVHDPDAPLINGFTHWVVYGIPAHVSSIPVSGGAEYLQGKSTGGRLGWVPLAPPRGHGAHHYYFHLYALDADLDLPEGLVARELLAEIDMHVISQARVVGTYSND